MIGRTVAGRGEIEFARLFLRQRDQLLHAVRRHARVDNQHDGCRRKQRDWSEVLGWIEGKLAVEGLVDGERAGRGEQERVAVRLRLGDEIAARIAAAARAVLDDDLLSEIVGELLRQNSRHHVHRSARRIWIDDANDTLGIGLRRRLNGEPE